ncbi:EAL domain-containing protein [Rugamonas rubra]|uniref:PAS domain S-box-containing protein/diguanylate cyclase (GGDEF) domain-containing protein n=1 Tax=Rugamonas rubra TaxID=758825 RepID=A0A1I4R6X4_9BURK|nr:EAL domain-containing protein [Rugamonas rubra]SFM47979.1 PAS domain S-box-containing protein/diguanylate cyclase (GGDEF) domain-containing protein [Rugamonas rubra]
MATILIVDDHVLNRQFLSALLSFGQHQLLAAADGQEGLLLARNARPDLIITDLMMPVMNGYEFVLAVRADADAALAAVPVIFYTSTFNLREARQMAKRCGVDWVLQKPATPDAILRAVDEALGLAAPAEPAVPAPPPARLAALDQQLAVCLRRAEDSNQQMSDMAARAPADAPLQRDMQDTTQRLSSSLAELQTVGLRLSALIDMGIEIAALRQPQDLCDYAAKVARQIGVARYCAVGIVEPGGAAARHFACHGLDPAEQAALAALAPDAGLLGFLLGQREPQRLRDLDRAPARAGLDGAGRPRRSFLAVPIRAGGRDYGWIYLADKLGADEFSEIDERAVATVATQLAVAYENLLLVDEINANVAQLEAELRARRELTERLRDSEARFRQLAENIGDIFYLVDIGTGRVLYISPAYQAIWGRSCASRYAAPASWKAAIHPDDLAEVERRERAWQQVPGHRDGYDYRYRIVRPDGALRHIHDRGFPIRDAHGLVYRVAGLAADVSEAAAQQERVGRLGQLYAVLSGINSAIVRLRDRDELLQEACRVAVGHGAFSMAWAGVIDPHTLAGRVVASAGAPDGYAELIKFGADPAGPGAARPASVAARQLRRVVCDDIDLDASLAPLRAELAARGVRALAALPILLDQRCCAVFVLFANETGFFAKEGRLLLLDELAGDLSFGLQYIDREERLRYLAYYDALTGLPNSMLFHDRTVQLLHGCAGGEGAAVVALNLKGFAQLNDEFGRHVGDQVLQRVAARLGGELREPFTVARIGGDTFAVALGALQGGADAVAALEQQVMQCLARPLTVGALQLAVAARAGVALYPDDGADAETLLKRAELALKQAKSSPQRWVFYAPRMNQAIGARIALEAALRQALEQGQFCMFYQPRVDLQGGHIVSAEALVRWRHPERGLVGPVEFIPLAEQTGLIVALGDWIIDAVCAQQAAWRGAGVDIVPVAINLSAVQFTGGQVQHTIAAAIAGHGLAPRDIEFELTESMVMDDPQAAAGHLRELKALGVKLSLDDFGTGYSSLAYLKRFPFDFVKIDRSFVSDLTNSAEDAAIATAVIAMSHSLGLRVVAEGVETEGQLQFLRRQRCDEMQGYYFSPPVPADEFGAMLRDGKCLAPPAESADGRDTLLLVDDEPDNLAALRRLLRKEGYRVLTAAGGAEALELLALEPAQVIVSDQCMPGMSGAAFLGLVKGLYPQTVRMILSGHADLAAVTDAINQGAVYKFLSKPWDDDALRQHIRDAFARQRHLQ